MSINYGRAALGLGLGYVTYRVLRSAFSDANAALDHLERRCPGDGSIPCKIVPAGSIDNRMKMLAGFIRKGALDPKVRRLAVRSVSKKCDGGKFCTPSRVALDELQTILGDFTDPGSELYRGMNEIEGVLAEFKQRYRYVSDALGADQFQSAKRTLFDFHGGDCDDATIALGSLCRALGYPVKVRVVRTKDAEDWNHVYLMVNPDKRGEKYVALDGSVDAVMHKGKKTPIFVGWEAPDRIVADRRDMDV